MSDRKFTEVDLDVKGRPHPTTKEYSVDPDELRKVVRWSGGVAGEGESFFPHPQRWRLKGIDKDLDKVEVRDLTRAITQKRVRPPTCVKSWEAAMGKVDWRAVGARYSAGLQTPKDFGPHFKLVLHRAMRTRGEDWQHVRCCLCRTSVQSLEHWAQCARLKPVFEDLRTLDGGAEWDDARLNLLGVGGSKCVAISPDGERREDPSNRVIPYGVSMIHFIMWKFVMIGITKLSREGTPFSVLEVIDSAKDRVRDRLTKLKVNLSKKRTAAQARGKPPRLEAERKWVRGIGSVGPDGLFVANEELELWLS